MLSPRRADREIEDPDYGPRATSGRALVKVVTLLFLLSLPARELPSSPNEKKKKKRPCVLQADSTPPSDAGWMNGWDLAETTTAERPTSLH